MATQSTTRTSVLQIILCFGATTLDGLDTGLIGIAGPTIAKQLNVSAAEMGPAYVATSIGAALGYLASGRLIERWGAQAVLVLSVAVFGVFTLLTPLVPSLIGIASLRLLTAIALGSALPAAICLALEHTSPDRRTATTVAVGAGLSFGGVIGGIFGGKLASVLGWHTLFYAAGVMPLLYALILQKSLFRSEPAKGDLRPSQSRRAPTATALIATTYRLRSICLWSFSFLIFSEVYALLFWIPTLLTGFGYSVSEASLGVAVFSVGGLLASIGLVVAVGVVRPPALLMIMTVLAALSVALFAASSGALWTAWLAAGGCGAALIACTIGQSALAVALYPSELRAAGIGFSAAAGRVGAIAGPGIIGILLASGLRPETIVLLSTIPVLLAGIALLIFDLADRRTPRARDASDRVVAAS